MIDGVPFWGAVLLKILPDFRVAKKRKDCKILSISLFYRDGKYTASTPTGDTNVRRFSQ